MTKPSLWVAWIAVALLLVAGGTAAHGPPTRRAQDTRLLADHSDDCGGDLSASLANCNGSHDLVGLDLHESHDATQGDLVVFRLIVCCDDAASGTYKDVLTLKANGQTKTFDVQTTNNQDFQGTGFLSVTKSAASDGHRFVLEGTVAASTLGGVGSRLTDILVESYKGSTRGDIMPGCYYSAPAPVSGSQTKVNEDPSNPRDPCTSADGESGTPYTRPSYDLRGPTYFVTVTVPESTQVPLGGEQTSDVRLVSKLSGKQTVTVTLSAGDGVQASWDGGGASTTVDLEQAATRVVTLHLVATGQAGTTGTVTLTVDTDLGGHTVHQVPFEVTSDGLDGGVDGGGDSNGDSGDGGDGGLDGTSSSHAAKDSPAPVAALLALALLALAAARRQA